MDSGLFVADLQLWNKYIVYFLDVQLGEQQLDFVQVWEKNYFAAQIRAVYVSFILILCDFIDFIPIIFSKCTQKTAMSMPLFKYLKMYLIDLMEL